MNRKPRASFWQFDPREEDATVEAMPSDLSIVNNDDRVLVSVRGRTGRSARGRESKDAVWLEMEDADALLLAAEIVSTIAGRDRS